MAITPENIAEWYFVKKHNFRWWNDMDRDNTPGKDYITKYCKFSNEGIKILFRIGDYQDLGSSSTILKGAKHIPLTFVIEGNNDCVIILWDSFWNELIKDSDENLMALYEDNDIPNSVIEERWEKEKSLVDFYDEWWYANQ